MQLNSSLEAIAENRLIAGWLRALSRRPDQHNRPHEADAELIPLPGGEQLLALTVDTVAEEIALGFYRDPETVGWMAAMVSLSDLAAVGATPLGLLVSATLPQEAASGWQAGVARGLEAACRAAGTYVLGGDTNFGAQPSVTTAAAGVVARERVLLRTGCRPGERLYATGRLGRGGPVAARALWSLPEALVAGEFRPRARLAAGQALAGLATACMDSSDGLIATLDQLARLNGVGFELTTPLAELLDPAALRLSEALGLDPLLMLAQPHGEFELLFTLEAARELPEEISARSGGAPLLLGRLVPEPGVIRLAGERPRVVDGARIRNLLDEVGGDLPRYTEELMRLVQEAAG